MRLPQPRQRHGASRVVVGLFAGTLTALPTGLVLAAPGAPRQDSDPQRIMVNCVSRPTASGGTAITLADALLQAANDPRDNLIEFDPAAFKGRPVQITLDVPIKIVGKAGGHDRIDGGAIDGQVILDVNACPDAGVIVAQDGTLTIARLTVAGGKQRAVLVKENGRLALDEVTIRDSQAPGLALFGEARATLVRSRLANNRTHGIEVHGAAQAQLVEVQVTGNGQSGAAGFDHAIIGAEGSTFDANSDWNVVLTNESRATLERCHLRGGGFANADVSESATLTLKESALDAGRRFGIFATGRATVMVAASQLRQHASRGIELQDRATLTIQGSLVDSNGDYGIILFEQSTIVAADTTFSHNAAHGVSLRGRATGAFEACTFVANRYSGLGCLDARDGGQVRASRCLFGQNGMRPIYRGPLHLDPLPPTPLRIEGEVVHCLADAGATIELYLDRAGEAARYLRTIRADAKGRFDVDCRDVPEGWVMTATATGDGSTSEFNVLAGPMSAALLSALLARTGPLSDAGGRINLDDGLRRWRTGTRLLLHIPKAPSVAVERYVRFMASQVKEWTGGAVTADVTVGELGRVRKDTVVVPIRYLPPDAPQLLGRGGVTYMKWDADGYFLAPMKIVLATGREPKDTCPRVLAHEVGHVLGLCHARVGLLSRMQGSIPPTPAFVNDFSPTMTYYDVLALHLLHSRQADPPPTLRQLVQAGLMPAIPDASLASAIRPPDEPTFSPPANQPPNRAPSQTSRP